MDIEVYHSNFKLENSYFWFVSRNKIVYEAFKEICGVPQGSNVLDIGIGTGGFASVLSRDYNVYGTDTQPLAIEYSRSRGMENLHLGTLDGYDPGVEIKAAFMLDVIEHIEDDSAVVRQVYDILPPGGWFIATVPAYQWMWSKHDVVHMHYRRYNKVAISELISSAGFKISYASYFNTFLFPLALLKRLWDKITRSESDKPHDEVSPMINKIFTAVFSSESALIPKIKLPFGLSILVIARKP